MNKVLKITGYILTGMVLIFSVLLLFACGWAKKTFNVGIQEILFTIKSPLKGTESGVVIDGVKYCLPPVITAICTYMILVVSDIMLKTQIHISVITKYKNSRLNIRKLFRRLVVIFTVITFISSLAYTEQQYQIVDFVKSRLDTTTIYEDYYVHPDSVNIRADGDEKNLICIYLESMETTYASTEAGGAQEVNYIPNLTRLANENISFSNTDKLGGFHNTIGNTWTVASILSTTGGIPFSFPTSSNAMSLRQTFASRLTNLGDILHKFGYNQYFLCGSDAEFGGRKTYFEQHGNYNIFDLSYAKTQGYIPENYFQFWGYEDKHLYEIAKNEITNAYQTGKPFNFTMLTVDTHNIGGYVCELCESKYDVYTADVVTCADKQISEFVEWCKTQPFYDETSIIIIGDHPRMDTYLVEDVIYYNRTMYNCFINCLNDNSKRTNREFTAMDIFPTILSAMGFEFDGNRIGLGTDMFSGKPTLAEELGFDYLNSELAKYSQYYINNFS